MTATAVDRESGGNDEAAILAKVLHRLDELSERQGRDAWLLEALSQRLEQIAASGARPAEGGGGDDEPATIELARRAEQMANVVSALVDAVATMRDEARGDLRALGEMVEGRAEAREERLMSVASERLGAQLDAAAAGRTEAVARAVCKSVEDVNHELRALGEDLKGRLAATTAARGGEGGAASGDGSVGAADPLRAELVERFDAAERAARQRSAAISARLEEALTGHAALLAASSERLDTMFGRLDRIDGRTEALTSEIASAEDISDRTAAKLAHKLAVLGEDLRRAVASSLDMRLRAELGSELGRQVDRKVAERVDSQVEEIVSGRLEARLAELVSDAVADRVADRLKGDVVAEASEAIVARLGGALPAALTGTLGVTVADQLGARMSAELFGRAAGAAAEGDADAIAEGIAEGIVEPTIDQIAEPRAGVVPSARLAQAVRAPAAPPRAPKAPRAAPASAPAAPKTLAASPSDAATREAAPAVVFAAPASISQPAAQEVAERVTQDVVIEGGAERDAVTMSAAAETAALDAAKDDASADAETGRASSDAATKDPGGDAGGPASATPQQAPQDRPTGGSAQEALARAAEAARAVSADRPRAATTAPEPAFISGVAASFSAPVSSGPGLSAPVWPPAGMWSVAVDEDAS